MAPGQPRSVLEEAVKQADAARQRYPLSLIHTDPSAVYPPG